eukprot:SAG11_NODE_960_length_6382_cov_8.585071_3_plen_154_part_00
MEIGARACSTNDRHNMKTDLCLRRELETTALQLLLNTTDTEQLGRRVNRLVEELDAFVTVEGDNQLLSPRRREALAGLRQFFSDIALFSDDEDVDSEEGAAVATRTSARPNAMAPTLTMQTTWRICEPRSTGSQGPSRGPSGAWATYLISSRP